MLWTYLRPWWIPTSHEKLAKGQEMMLGAVSSQVSFEDISAGIDGHTIHTVRLSSKARHAADRNANDPTPIVLLHGYFMGSASWGSSTLDSMTVGDREVFALDWPGWGRSSRPEFPTKKGVQACEDYFVDRLESWRQSAGLDRMVLLGHSFGGYFAACYTMKYPENVEALILASPVGMGEKKPGGVFTDPVKRAELPLMRRWFVNFAEKLWESRYTPQDIVRFFGPFGHRLINWYVERRFIGPREAGTMECSPDALKMYLYHLAAQPGCSDYCLGELLSFGAFARRPISARLAERLKELGALAPRVSSLYGEHDWMDATQGVGLAKELTEHDVGKGSVGCNEVLRVEGAGHQLFIDNPRAFSAAVQRLLGIGPPAVQGLYHTLYSKDFSK